MFTLRGFSSGVVGQNARIGYSQLSGNKPLYVGRDRRQVIRLGAKKSNAANQQCHCQTVCSATPVVNEIHIRFVQQKETSKLNIIGFPRELTITCITRLLVSKDHGATLEVVRPYVLTLVILSFVGHAADAPGKECAVRGHYAEEMLLSAVTKDGVKGIERGNTLVEVLSLSPVSDALARQFAQADAKTGNGLYYYGIYHYNGAMNRTAKYTYTNVKGASNVYIVK